MQIAKSKSKPKGYKKRLFQENTVDPETQEVVPRRWIDMTPISGDNFVQMHLQNIAQLHFLTDAQYRLLNNLNLFVEYDTNEFHLNPKRKEELVAITGLKYNTINQSVSRLVKKNLIIKISGSTYQMNPTLFFKGSEIKRAEYLEFIIRYRLCPECGDPKPEEVEKKKKDKEAAKNEERVTNLYTNDV